MSSAGLSATELAAACAALQPLLQDAEVLDVARLEGKDDLLLFVRTAEGNRSLHIVTGGPRARLCTTRRRFRKVEFSTGPLVDRLRQKLTGCRFVGLTQPDGERSCHFELRDPDGHTIGLQVELFGARGFWCVTDAQARIQELSRLPESAHRELKPGALYAPPAPRPEQTDPPSRFAPPVLDAIDRHFTHLDQEGEAEGVRRRLHTVLDRACRRLGHKIDGLSRQQEEIQRVPEIRNQADMLLAYGFGAPPGATTLDVPDPNDPDRTLTLTLEPGVPVQTQAERLYKRARKLEDSVAVSAERISQARTELANLEQHRATLDAASDVPALLELQAVLADLGLLPRPKSMPKPALSSKERNLQKITKGHNLRRFTSAEGHLILVGRTNHENDRLSMSVARGNDLWFHVGQGYAGSHVVIRLPKEKTASLESLLDAGTLAIHFSKARNASKCEVIYTLAKNVRKPKGLPPGRVTTTNTKTLFVQMDSDRLQRLLDSAATS